MAAHPSWSPSPPPARSAPLCRFTPADSSPPWTIPRGQRPLEPGRRHELPQRHHRLGVEGAIQVPVGGRDFGHITFHQPKQDVKMDSHGHDVLQPLLPFAVATAVASAAEQLDEQLERVHELLYASNAVVHQGRVNALDYWPLCLSPYAQFATSQLRQLTKGKAGKRRGWGTHNQHRKNTPGHSASPAPCCIRDPSQTGPGRTPPHGGRPRAPSRWPNAADGDFRASACRPCRDIPARLCAGPPRCPCDC